MGVCVWGGVHAAVRRRGKRELEKRRGGDRHKHRPGTREKAKRVGGYRHRAQHGKRAIAGSRLGARAAVQDLSVAEPHASTVKEPASAAKWAAAGQKESVQFLPVEEAKVSTEIQLCASLGASAQRRAVLSASVARVGFPRVPSSWL